MKVSTLSQRYSTPGEKLKAFPPVSFPRAEWLGFDKLPKGFRMLAGSGTVRSFDPNNLEQRAVTHNCLDYAGSGAAGEWNVSRALLSIRGSCSQP